MNPLNILNQDLSTFLMATQKVFDAWNDKVAEGFKNGCVERIKSDWNAYLQEMNTRINIFMRAEKTIDDEIAKYEREYKKK
ncbi:MAG: hypothetical protein J6W05_06105 [Prevotella sp.]|nr:hypothetical protein [Prevotella sp.]